MRGPDVETYISKVPIPTSRRVSKNALSREKWVVADGIFFL